MSRKFSCRRGYTVPGNVSMPLIRPDFDFKSHPERNFQDIFWWMGGLWGSPQKRSKSRFQIFESPQLRFWVSNFWWYWNLQYSHDLEHILKRVPGLDLLVDVEISLQNSHILRNMNFKSKNMFRNICLHWKMIPNRFPVFPGALLSHSKSISI